MALNIVTQLIGGKCNPEDIDEDNNNHCNPLKRISVMRIKNDEYNEDHDENDNEEQNESVKYELYFKRVRRMISDRKQIGLEFDRFESNNNKFNITGNSNVSSSGSNGHSVTFLDTFLKGIELNFDPEIIYIPTKTMKNFKKFILAEVFDSESILLDIDEHNQEILN